MQAILVEVVIFGLELVTLQLIVPSGGQSILISELLGLLISVGQIGGRSSSVGMRRDVVEAGVVALVPRALVIIFGPPRRERLIIAGGVSACIRLALRVSIAVGLGVAVTVHLLVGLVLLRGPSQRGSCAAGN